MTEPLHDLLSRLADDAVPGSDDPTLWDRARRARRRERGLRASAAAVAGVALVVGAAVLGLGPRSAPPPADHKTPSPHETRAGIPSLVRGIHGDGGLELETDLAVGPASVAIANQSGAFVITAADGTYHRLRLPGFDPAAFDERHNGLALSPDGSRLAYGWRAGSGVKAGTRILDLRIGELTKIPGVPPYAKRGTVAVSTYGYGWSPDGRYLAFETGLGSEGPHYYVGVDADKARFVIFASDARAASCQMPACSRMTMTDPHRVAQVDMNSSWAPFDDPALVFGSFHRRSVLFDPTPLPPGRAWTVGRFAPDGRRLLVQPDGVGTGLLLVTAMPGRHSTTTRPLDPAEWPEGARIDVLGWVGPDHALAVLNRGTGPDTWEPGGTVVLVDASSGAVGPVHLDVVGRVEAGDPASAYSFATDLASVDAPTRQVGGAS